MLLGLFWGRGLECFDDILLIVEMFWECLEDVLGMCLGCFGNVLGMFQGRVYGPSLLLSTIVGLIL